MSFEIGFRGSTNTRGAKAFIAGVARAVERRRARHDPAVETVALENGAVIHLGLEPSAGMALIIADDFSLELSQFTYALADETATIIQAIQLTAATPSAGDAPAILTHFPEIWRLEHEDMLFSELNQAFEMDRAEDEAEADRLAAVQQALAERRAARAAGRPSRQTFTRPPQSSFLKRLSDALFGKAI